MHLGRPLGEFWWQPLRCGRGGFRAAAPRNGARQRGGCLNGDRCLGRLRAGRCRTKHMGMNQYLLIPFLEG